MAKDISIPPPLARHRTDAIGTAAHDQQVAQDLDLLRLPPPPPPPPPPWTGAATRGSCVMKITDRASRARRRAVRRKAA
jgi:hypothetical protein